MTPAVQAAKKARVNHRLHKYESQVSLGYGQEAADILGISPDRVFKTLIAQGQDRRFLCAVVPVAGKLDLKKLAKAAGCKKADMADTDDAERVTGYLVGGISPLGQKKRLPTFVDVSAESLETMYISAGRRGLEIELSPTDLAMLTGAKFEQIAQID